MNYEIGICDSCKSNTRKVVKSDNKLAKTLCATCIAESIDTNSSKDIKNLSVSLQIPFSIKEYYTLALGHVNAADAMSAYMEFLSGQTGFEEPGLFAWDKIDEHFSAAQNFTRALAMITPLKDSLMNRGAEKWGEGFTFQEYVRLESFYENTIKQFGISSAVQQDAVKKASKMSISIDKLIEGGDFKAVGSATKAYVDFLKAANIEDLLVVSNDETIRTVADLVLYLEKNGFEFSKMMPDIEPDVLDKTIDNYMENVKNLVYTATGLDVQLRTLIEKMQDDVEKTKITEIAETHILEEDLDEDFLDIEEQKFIRELETEELDVDFDDLFD